MDKNSIEAFVAENPDWYQEDDELVAGFEFKDFAATRALVEKIMKLSDEIGHHPTVTFGYNTVEVKTCTHDAGGKITKKDLALAAAISDLVS